MILYEQTKKAARSDLDCDYLELTKIGADSVLWFLLLFGLAFSDEDISEEENESGDEEPKAR